MKITILFAAFLLIGSLIGVNVKAQSIPTPEQKQTINPIVDKGFTTWSENWRFDRYVGRSAKINSIDVDEDYGDIVARGNFEYRRVGQVFTGTFVAKINGEGKLMTLTYTDAGGVRGSKTF